MRIFSVRFADGIVLVVDACDETDARQTASALHPDVEVVLVEDAASGG
jgi:hypothetical protein